MVVVVVCGWREQNMAGCARLRYLDTFHFYPSFFFVCIRLLGLAWHGLAW